MKYKLGKKAARPDAVAFKFGSFFHAADLPTPPRTFGHINIRQPWNMLANNQAACCVWSGAAHETMIWCREAGSSAVFDDHTTLADYSAVTGFNPRDPDSDNGTDMSAAASYRRKVGVVDIHGQRHKIEAYASLRPGNLHQVATAAYLLGAVGIGLQLPDYAEDQFDRAQPWSLRKGGDTAGGHYVTLCGRNSRGNFMVISWGRLHAITPEALEAWMDEGLAYFSLEPLRNRLSPEGFDADRLRAALDEIATLPRGDVNDA